MMSGGKQKLRPWLEDMITKGEIDGLRWLNPEKTKFRIPWKHGGKQDWTPDNSRIFMEWAKHTGKYREGVDGTNYPTWKTRLRCAFNKASDIEEVKLESRLNCHEPFRVYILKEARRGRTNSNKANDTKVLKQNKAEQKLERVGDVEWEGVEAEVSRSSISNLPTMIEELENSTEDGSSSSLGDIFADDLDDSMFQHIEGDMDTFDGTYQSDEMDAVQQTALKNDVMLETSDEKFLMLLQMNEDQNYQARDSVLDYRIKLEVFYCGRPVYENDYPILHGLRVAVSGCATSVQVSPPSVLPSVVNNLLSGDPPTMYLPLCGTLLSSPHFEKIVDHLLTKSLTEGLLLWMSEEGDIFAYRFCPGAIYYVSKEETDGKPIKIPLSKDKPEFVKIFTYRNCFTAEGVTNEVQSPPNAVYLCCGQGVDLQDIPEKAYIYIKITPFNYQPNYMKPAVNFTEIMDLLNVSSPADGSSSSVQFEMETQTSVE